MTIQQANHCGIIEIYAEEIAAPVGSVTLWQCSHTIRSEDGKNLRDGTIEAPHTSAGRFPTDPRDIVFMCGITAAQMTELPSGIDSSTRAVEAHVNSNVDTSDNRAVSEPS